MGKSNSKYAFLHSQFFSFVRKEFKHVLRDKKTLLILFGMPIVQILIFGFVLTNEVKNANIAIVDEASNATTRKISTKINASNYFNITQSLRNPKNIEDVFQKGNIKMVLVFPPDFKIDLSRQKQAHIQLIADATDPNKAKILTNYASAIIRDFQKTMTPTTQMPYQIKVETKMLYNPQLEGKYNFVPGMMALVLLLVCVFMTSISIVKEKETGTMELLLVSPFKPILIIFSKVVPYFILSLINVITILLLSVFVLNVPIHGSILLLLAESILFIITCLSLGILISIRTSSQQAAMLISLMGMMLPTIMFSGFIFPIANMPLPLQWISNIIPAKWFYTIAKGIMIKGVGIADLWKETLILLVMTGAILGISLKQFNIRIK